MDNRGLGLSSWGDYESQPWTIVDMARDVKAVLDDWGILKTHIIGFSMGGTIVQQFAIDYPDRLESLISVMSWPGDTAVVPAERVIAWMKRYMDPEISPSRRNEILKDVWEVMSGSKYPVNKTFYEEREKVGIARGGANPNCPHLKVAAVPVPRKEGLKKVKIPTLVIHGSEDPVVDVKYGKETAELIEGSKLLVYEGIGHDMPTEMFEEFQRDVIKFYQSIGKK